MICCGQDQDGRHGAIRSQLEWGYVGTELSGGDHPQDDWQESCSRMWMRRGASGWREWQDY